LSLASGKFKVRIIANLKPVIGENSLSQRTLNYQAPGFTHGDFPSPSSSFRKMNVQRNVKQWAAIAPG